MLRTTALLLACVTLLGCTETASQKVTQSHSMATVVVAPETFVFGSGRANSIIVKDQAYQAQLTPNGEFVIWAGSSHTYVMLVNVPVQFGFILDSDFCTTGEVASKSGSIAFRKADAISNNNNNYDAPKGVCFMKS